MNRKDLIFISILAGVLGVFVLLSAISKDIPQLTARAEHEGMVRNTSPETCLSCHDPGSSIAPIDKTKHPMKGLPPKKDNCFLCHKPPSAAVAAFTWSATREGR
jgi:hypothetical protein